MRLPHFTLGVGLELAFFAASCWAQTSAERVVIDARAPGRPFQMFQGQKALKDLNDAGVSIF